MVCKISQQKPHFGQDCINYKFDNDEYQTLKNNKKAFYSGLNEQGNSFGRKVNSNTISYEQTHISERSKSKLGSKLPLILEIKRSTIHYLFYHIFPSLFFIVGIPYYLRKNMNDEFIKVLIIGSTTFFIGVIIWAAMKIKNNKPKMILNKKGIKIDEKELIIWRDVLMTQIKTKQEKFSHEYLCISQISKTKDIEVDIDKLNILGWQLGHYIEMYKRKYQQL